MVIENSKPAAPLASPIDPLIGAPLGDPPLSGEPAETTTEVMVDAVAATATDVDRIWTQIRNLQTMMVNAGVIQHYEVNHIFERIVGAVK